jgi:integrase
VAKVDSHLRKHLLPHFGDRRIGSIRPSEVQGWVKGRSLELAPATVEVLYRYLAAIFRAAVKDRLIADSPCGDVRLPRRERREVVPLTTEQVVALTDVMPDRYRALVTLSAGTGLRQGEAFGVTLGAIDWMRRILRVDQQVVLLPKRGPGLAPPKTTASRRTIPLPQVVVDALAAHLAAFPSGESRLVFTDHRDGPIRRNRFNDGVWQPAVKAAGLPAGTGFHDLRHYYASLLIRRGESVKVVQARLGHASASETLDTYAHSWPDSEDRTRAAVDGVLGISRGAAAEREGTSGVETPG